VNGTVLYTLAVASTAGTETGRQLISAYNGATAAVRQLNVDRMYFITAAN
jgi:hypothetical protein